MNIERTMHFILDRQAKARLHQEKTDRQIAALLKLVKAGMKMLVRRQEKLERLDRKVDRLIDISLGKRTNGRRRA
jgi:flagellar motility protein MotE (MotC chaperone)